MDQRKSNPDKGDGNPYLKWIEEENSNLTEEEKKEQDEWWNAIVAENPDLDEKE